MGLIGTGLMMGLVARLLPFGAACADVAASGAAIAAMINSERSLFFMVTSLFPKPSTKAGLQASHAS